MNQIQIWYSTRRFLFLRSASRRNTRKWNFTDDCSQISRCFEAFKMSLEHRLTPFLSSDCKNALAKPCSPFRLSLLEKNDLAASRNTDEASSSASCFSQFAAANRSSSTHVLGNHIFPICLWKDANTLTRGQINTRVSGIWFSVPGRNDDGRVVHLQPDLDRVIFGWRAPLSRSSAGF